MSDEKKVMSQKEAQEAIDTIYQEYKYLSKNYLRGKRCQTAENLNAVEFKYALSDLSLALIVDDSQDLDELRKTAKVALDRFVEQKKQELKELYLYSINLKSRMKDNNLDMKNINNIISLIKNI